MRGVCGAHPWLTCVRLPFPSHSRFNQRCDICGKRDSEPRAVLRHTMDGQRTCQTAPNVVFESVEELKAHYKSDWHRYNLKRKARKCTRCCTPTPPPDKASLRRWSAYLWWGASCSSAW